MRLITSFVTRPEAPRRATMRRPFEPPKAASLTELLERVRARVIDLGVEPREQQWLSALGLFRGQTVEILRRGLWGGPIHVRTGSGGELALDRSLAARITVHIEPMEPAE